MQEGATRRPPDSKHKGQSTAPQACREGFLWSREGPHHLLWLSSTLPGPFQGSRGEETPVGARGRQAGAEGPASGGSHQRCRVPAPREATQPWALASPGSGDPRRTGRASAGALVGLDPGGSPRVPRTLLAESARLRGRAIRAHSASERARSPGPETERPACSKAGQAWRRLCPSAARQDTWVDTQPGSGRGAVPAHPAPEKQTQHRDPVLRSQHAGSAQRLGPHPLTSRQNPALRP